MIFDWDMKYVVNKCRDYAQPRSHFCVSDETLERVEAAGFITKTVRDLLFFEMPVYERRL